MLVAGNAHRQGVLRQYFKDLKDGVGMSILENLMEARRNGVLVRRCFFGWANTSGFQERLEEKMLEAQMYDQLTALSRCFWQWENYTKARAAGQFQLQSALLRKSGWPTITKRVQRQNSALAVVRHRQKVLFGAFDAWHDLATVASAERSGGNACYRLRKSSVASQMGDVCRGKAIVPWQAVDGKKALPEVPGKSMAAFCSPHHYAEEVGAPLGNCRRAQCCKGVEVEQPKQDSKTGPKFFVANAFARQKRMIRGMILWQQHVDEVLVDREKCRVAVEAYHNCMVRKALRGLRLEIVFSKGKTSPHSTSAESFNALLSAACSASGIGTRTVTELCGSISSSAAPQSFCRVAAVLGDCPNGTRVCAACKASFSGEMPAETFGGMEGRSNHAAVKASNNSWGCGMGNRKLGARVLKAWRRVVHMRAVWRGKCRIADDFSRLVLLNRCLLHWNTVTMMGRDYY